MRLRTLWAATTLFGLGARAFNFSISTPIQCSNLTVSIQGGTAPYELILVPIGELKKEIRTIVDTNSTQQQLSFPLLFPSGSQFSVMMNDATGVGTGGTGIVQTVAASDDSSCLPTEPSQTKFFFYMEPTTLTQCGTTNISWDPTPKSQAPVSLLGLIPGGTSFQLPVDPNLNYYVWNVNVRKGTSIQLFVGDKRGKGSGGSISLTVQDGSNSCINDESPSSTAGSPAGGITGPTASASATSASTPTSTAGSPGGSVGHKPNVGAIVGGVLGGLVGLAIILAFFFFLFCRRKRSKPHSDVDLMDGETTAASPMLQNGEGFYRPEPFIVPEGQQRVGTPTPEGGPASSAHGHGDDTPPTLGVGGLAVPPSSRSTSSYAQSSSGGASVLGPASTYSSGPTSTNGTSVYGPGRSTAARTGKGPRPLRVANIVQHEDGGAAPPAGPSNTEEVVELPPMYSDIQRTTEAR